MRIGLRVVRRRLLPGGLLVFGLFFEEKLEWCIKTYEDVHLDYDLLFENDREERSERIEFDVSL